MAPITFLMRLIYWGKHLSLIIPLEFCVRATASGGARLPYTHRVTSTAGMPACAGASSHPSPWEGAGSHSHVLLGQFPWEIDSSGILPMAYFIFPYPKLKSAQCDLGMCRNYIFRSLRLYPSHQPPFIHREWAGWSLKTFRSMPFHAIPVGSHGH